MSLGPSVFPAELTTDACAVQVICIPIPNSKLTDEQRTGLTAKIDEITLMLEDASVRAKSDTSENHTPGWKYNHWELKGVPIRLEVTHQPPRIFPTTCDTPCMPA
jgi:prolyl-tRNA synthetase